MDTITIKDIARICGVGPSTVSRALNNHPDINQETKQKILDAVEQYGFVPNNSARNLKITATNNIAILVKGMSNPFFMNMIEMMEDDIRRAKYYMELRRVDEKTDEVEVAIELIKEKKLQGIIFLGGLSTHSPEELEKIDVPFVLSTISVPKEAEGIYSSVSVDDEAESYKMTKYLIDKGHRRIAILAGPESEISVSDLRMQGYLRALRESNIEIDDNLIWNSIEGIDSYSMDNGYLVMNKNLKKECKFDAVFAICDAMAMGAIRALSEAGISVPKDVSVAGFDGIALGKYCIPSITTISQPFAEMAHMTTAMLFDVINKEKSHKRIVLEGDLTERESVRDRR